MRYTHVIMSTRKGNTAKNAQKYQNSLAYRAGRYGQSKQTKIASCASLGGICKRCREKLEWKKRFGKYKPLTAPKSCVSCKQRTVKQAYHSLCHGCARSKKVCAKCREKEEIVESFPLSTTDQIAEESELRRNLRFMTERERRKFLREQQNGSGKKTAEVVVGAPKDGNYDGDEGVNRGEDGSGEDDADEGVNSGEDDADGSDDKDDADKGVNSGEDDADGSDAEDDADKGVNDDGDEGVNGGEDDADGSDDGDSEDDGNSSDDTLTEMCAKLVVSHQPSPSPRPEMPSDESLTKHHDFITS